MVQALAVRKGRTARTREGLAWHRSELRRAAAGFSLMELMVVVVLIAILAVMAVPSMMVAREDRLAFRSADSIARVIHEARTRAMARGAAELVLITSDGTVDRGSVVVFESIAATTLLPVSSCKISSEWAGVPAGSTTNPIIKGYEMNGSAGSLQTTTGLQTALTLNKSGVASTPKVIVLCFTPGGRLYVAGGTNIAAPIAALPLELPFAGEIIVGVERRPGGSATAVGLTRNVIINSAGGTRLKSQ